MKVLAVSPLASVAGAEVMLLRLVPELRSRRWDVEATVPGKGELEERLRKDGVPVVRLPLGLPAQRKPVSAVAGLARAARVVAGADVVLLNGLSTQRVLQAVRLRRRPAVLHVTNPIVAGVPAWSRSWTWSVVRAVITDSEVSAAECEAAGAPADLLHPLHPPAWEGVMEPRAAPVDGPGRVGFLGRLEPRKGIEDLIVAARRFLRGRTRASVTIVGAPSESAPPGYVASLRAAARASGVMDRISFSGWRDDSGEALAEFDVICVPSHAEPYGTVAAEAAARGVPVVATSVGGLREVVVDGATGTLVPPATRRRWRRRSRRCWTTRRCGRGSAPRRASARSRVCPGAVRGPGRCGVARGGGTVRAAVDGRPLPYLRAADLPEQVLLPVDLRRARADVADALSIYRASLWPGVPPALGATDHRVQAGAGLEPAPVARGAPGRARARARRRLARGDEAAQALGLVVDRPGVPLRERREGLDAELFALAPPRAAQEAIDQERPGAGAVAGRERQARAVGRDHARAVGVGEEHVVELGQEARWGRGVGVGQRRVGDVEELPAMLVAERPQARAQALEHRS